MVSGGITNSRISGAHYSNTQAPPAIFMSDEEDAAEMTVQNVKVKHTNTYTKLIVIVSQMNQVN
jgi:hypothetical protein